MGDYLNIGCSPVDEDCAQVGEDGYRERATKELEAFKGQLERVFPDGDFRIKWFSHDFGSYGEVVAMLDGDESPRTEAAFDAESETPERWDYQARMELGLLTVEEQIIEKYVAEQAEARNDYRIKMIRKSLDWAQENLDESGEFLRAGVFTLPTDDDNTFTIADFMNFLSLLGKAWFGAVALRCWNLDLVRGDNTKIIPFYYAYMYEQGMRLEDFYSYLEERASM
jgi:hypothetical protein